MDAVADHLARHDFKALFVEVLGWDHASAEHRFEADGFSFSFRLIAHKRGFQILVCETDRYTLFNRRRLRELERQVFRPAHEHIVIYACTEPRKQVWQWSIHMPDGRRLRHREHPFFSGNPPQPLVLRLNGLRFSLDEEEHVTLLDALDRARLALDTHAEQDLFVKYPRYAEQGDKLALAMVSGGLAEFQAFVLFHRRLARWGTKRLVKHFGMDEEDAEQIGNLCVLKAALQFDPHRGFQFSTYATRVIRQATARMGPEESLRIRVPAPKYWPVARLDRLIDRVSARHGLERARRFAANLERRSPDGGVCIRRVHRAACVEVLSEADVTPNDHPADPNAGPIDRSIADETSRRVQEEIELLSPEDADLIRARYGFAGAQRTLRQIADDLCLTREAIRQRQLRVEAQLRLRLQPLLGGKKPLPLDVGADAAMPRPGNRCRPQLSGSTTESKPVPQVVNEWWPPAEFTTPSLIQIRAASLARHTEIATSVH